MVASKSTSDSRYSRVQRIFGWCKDARRLIPLRLKPLAAALLASNAFAGTVTNCLDDGSVGSLRHEVTNALPGDTIDFQLSCSTITLNTGSGPIVVSQAADTTGLGLQISGPGASALTIDGAAADRVITHTAAAGKLKIEGVTIKNGLINDASNLVTPTKGGCIASYSSLYLTDTIVSGCGVVSTTTTARGGGIYAKDLTVTRSTITGNSASNGAGTSPRAYAFGGGIDSTGAAHLIMSAISNNTVSASGSHGEARGGGFRASTGNVTISMSTISGNSATATVQPYAVGGGVDIAGGGDRAPYGVDAVSISATTISNNTAANGAGIWFAANSFAANSATIKNSTISSNTATVATGGVVLAGKQFPVTAVLGIYNSTIAFNSGPDYGGLFAGSGNLTMESTIVANNTNTNTVGQAPNNKDVYVSIFAGQSGAANLVMSSSTIPQKGSFLAVPLGTDPILGPLQNNGGPTLTHMLLADSPAIGVGSNSQASAFDQRGAGHPRMTGTSTDIGAMEFDPIFADGHETTP